MRLSAGWLLCLCPWLISCNRPETPPAIAPAAPAAANLVEITLPDDTPWGGKPVKRLELPRDASLVTILRGARVIVPESDEPLEGGDELLFVAVTEVEDELRELLLRPSAR